MNRVSLAVVICLWASGCPQSESLPPVQGVEVPLNSGNFQTEVLDSPVPVLVDFGATWCGPCRAMEPVIAQLSLDYQGRLKVGKVDVDNSPALAAEYDISGIPAMVLFIDGQEAGRTIGGQAADELTAWVDARLPAASAAASPPATEPAPANGDPAEAATQEITDPDPVAPDSGAGTEG